MFQGANGSVICRTLSEAVSQISSAWNLVEPFVDPFRGLPCFGKAHK